MTTKLSTGTMHRQSRWSRRLLACVSIYLSFALLSLPITVTADNLKQNYCSPENTANTPSSQSIYQSLGLCQTTCASNFALAVVQGHFCWCSNYLPADTAQLSYCDVQCPGYPYENCGNSTGQLYGYMVLNKAEILGTAGASSKTKSSSSSSTSTSATWTPKPVTAVLTRTVSNQPVTQTVTSAPTPLNGDSSEGGTLPKKSSKSGGTSGGLIAGVVIGTIAGMSLIGGAIFFFWRRRRQHYEAEVAAANGGSGTGTPRPLRTTSMLSGSGLIDTVYPAAGPRGGPISNPSYNSGQSGGRPEMSDRRNSRPLFYDQRLNPAALLDIDNASRVSVNTIPDNRDFSRPLNVTNPDV